MKVAITGGAGFVGSHLAEFLLAQRHQVTCLDNLITGNSKNLDNIRGNENFSFIEYDVTNYIDLPDSVDYILHFASPASPVDFDRFPIQILKAGGVGTFNALGLAKAKNAKFLLASTSEVYGDSLINPQTEDYWGNVNPIGPRGVYDEAKRFAEALTMAYHRHHGIDVKIARIFNTYGPRMRKEDGRAIPTFINQALNNESLTVFGNGSQTRSFCYISDLIKAIHKLMLSNINEPVNLGNPHEMTVKELAETVIKFADSKSQIVYKPLPQDDPKTRRPDITKAQRLLNWQPQISLEEGLLKTIEWFRANQ
ncbi:MAG: UDP-glucuronic acid decarboxylase family protein [Dehalococcoidales bacterium]